VVGGRAAAMGRTAVCEQGLWALQNNPAGLAYLSGWHFGIYYENQWLLKETAFKSGGIAKAIDGIGCFGLSVNQFGGSDYHENKFGIAYARGFGPYLQLGLQFDYLLLHWGENFPNRGTPGFELGAQSQLTKRLRLGAYLFNPIPFKLKTLNEDRLPIVMRFGVAYQLADNFISQCELEKNSEQRGMQLRCGLEYVVFNDFSLRAGAQYNPNILTFGAGYEFKHICVDVAAQLHQLLGASVQIGITGNLKNKDLR
jgi:hypothetical protein